MLILSCPSSVGSLVKGNEMVTQGCNEGQDSVDSGVEGQEALIDVNDVDSTARFISHPAWSQFGDHIVKED